jgi:hypothetical protein
MKYIMEWLSQSPTFYEILPPELLMANAFKYYSDGGNKTTRGYMTFRKQFIDKFNIDIDDPVSFKAVVKISDYVEKLINGPDISLLYDKFMIYQIGLVYFQYCIYYKKLTPRLKKLIEEMTKTNVFNRASSEEMIELIKSEYPKLKDTRIILTDKVVKKLKLEKDIKKTSEVSTDSIKLMIKKTKSKKISKKTKEIIKEYKKTPILKKFKNNFLKIFRKKKTVQKTPYVVLTKKTNKNKRSKK